MRQAALMLCTPRREAHVRLAFAGSTATVAVLAIVEGLVLMGLGWDWGYKLVSEPYRQVYVLDLAMCPRGAWGVSLLSVFPRDLGNGNQRLIALQPLDSSAGAPAKTWPMAGARALVALPNRSQVIVGSVDGALHVVDASPAWTPPRLFGRQALGQVDFLACSPDGRFLLSLGRLSLCVWDLHEERMLWHRTGEPFTSGVFRPDSSSLIYGCDDGSLVEIDSLTGESRRELVRFELPVHHVDLSPDGQRIAAHCGNRTVLLYDLQAGRIQWSRRRWAAPARFSPEGDRLATFAYTLENGWSVELWDAHSGDIVASMPGHTRRIFGVSFAPDGLLYSWSGDRTIRQWDTQRHSQIRCLPALVTRDAW